MPWAAKVKVRIISRLRSANFPRIDEIFEDFNLFPWTNSSDSRLISSWRNCGSKVFYVSRIRYSFKFNINITTNKVL